VRAWRPTYPGRGGNNERQQIATPMRTVRMRVVVHPPARKGAGATNSHALHGTNVARTKHREECVVRGRSRAARRFASRIQAPLCHDARISRQVVHRLQGNDVSARCVDHAQRVERIQLGEVGQRQGTAPGPNSRSAPGDGRSLGISSRTKAQREEGSARQPAMTSVEEGRRVSCSLHRAPASERPHAAKGDD